MNIGYGRKLPGLYGEEGDGLVGAGSGHLVRYWLLSRS